MSSANGGEQSIDRTLGRLEAMAETLPARIEQILTQLCVVEKRVQALENRSVIANGAAAARLRDVNIIRLLLMVLGIALVGALMGEGAGSAIPALIKLFGGIGL